MTLEKDNKEQSKYCFSYPKLLVLDVKWENYDIKDAEWTNIPKFPLYYMEIRRKRCSAAQKK